MKRRNYVLARQATERDVARQPWSAETKARYRESYPLRFFCGFDAMRRPRTSIDLPCGARIFYESPLLASTEAELRAKGFRVLEVLLVNAERAAPGSIE